MKRILNKLIAAGIVLAMLSGCATTSNDATRTKAEGTGIGAVLGGLAGAGVGYLLGGKKGAIAGGAAGALLGAGAGFLVGSTVAERKQKYANAEDRLNGEIQVVMQYNKALEEYNVATTNQINTLDKEISDLKSRYKARRVHEIALKNKQNEINNLIRDADKIKNDKSKELMALTEYQKSINETQDQLKVAKLDQEVSTLRNNIAMLDNNNKQMAQLVQSLSVRR